MTQAFADQRDRGQSVAGLWASQAAIYQRYGFAPAGLNRGYAIDVADIRLLDSLSEPLPVTRHRPAAVLDAIRQVYKVFIADRTGYIHRGKIAVAEQRVVGDGANGADGPVYVAVAGSLQAPRGYVVYTLRAAQVAHRARPQEIKIRDMAFLDMAACHSLWQFLARHDLVGRVARPNAPMDDPAQAMRTSHAAYPRYRSDLVASGGCAPGLGSEGLQSGGALGYGSSR